MTNARKTAIAAALIVALCFLAVYVGKAHAAPGQAGECIDYTVSGTPYRAVTLIQTPTSMTFTGWALGTCGPPTPPAGLYASGRLSYGGRGGFIANANLLDWAVLWGRQGVEAQPLPFPGASGATPVWTPGAGQYTCSKFRTGAAGSVSGQIKNSREWSQQAVDISLSTACGDFAPSQPKCLAANAPNNNNPSLSFQVGGSNTFKCVLPPNADVYENIRRTSPTARGAISVIGQQG